MEEGSREGGEARSVGSEEATAREAVRQRQGLLHGVPLCVVCSVGWLVYVYVSRKALAFWLTLWVVLDAAEMGWVGRGIRRSQPENASGPPMARHNT